MKKLLWLAAGVLALTFAAAPGEAQGRNRNRIEREEIEQSHASSVLQLIRSRRSAWLNRQHPAGFQNGGNSQLMVFVDRARLDNVQELQQVACADAETVEFLTPAQTEYRFGVTSANGAIAITSRGTRATPTEHPSQGM
jgi:hypothetical protein